MKSQRLLVLMLFAMAVFTACYDGARHLSEAKTLYETGLKQRAAKRTDAAAESFSNALIELNYCDENQEDVQLLKAKIKDNLGVMYWKNGLNDEALALYLESIETARTYGDSTLLMTVLRDAGRVSFSMQQIDRADAYYNEALCIAKGLNDKAFANETFLEMSHDLYLEGGDYEKAIATAQRALAEGADSSFCNLVIGLSYYYVDQNDTALVFLEKATYGTKASIRMSAYQCMYFIHQASLNYQLALECHELFNENMMLSDREYKTQEVQRIKSDYDLQMQKYNLQAEQKVKNLQLYGLIGLLLTALILTLLLLHQKSLKQRLKEEEAKNQIEVALKKNKVYLAALALTEQITASTLDFNLTEDDWKDFVDLINLVYNGFAEKLKAQYPSLTPSDVQICCLTKQGFSNQVLAILMNMQSASYARRKSRIKQEKMNGLNDERSFEEIINEI